MKLVMTLLIRNEADLLRENILYHLAQGVDFFIVTDNLSVDNSLAILQEFVEKGVVYLIEEKADTYSQAAWVTRMARLARAKFNADWVINNDADEFWWPKEGSLKTTLKNIPTDYSIVSASRHNFLHGKETTGSSLKHMIVRYVNSRNMLGRPLPGKVCHRGLENISVSQGNHDVSSLEKLKLYPEDPLEIFHFPVRSYAQFEKKISLGGAAYERNTELHPAIGDVWRKLYVEWKSGNLINYFNKDVLTDEEIEAGIRDGMLLRDTRLRDFLISQKIISIYP